MEELFLPYVALPWRAPSNARHHAPHSPADGRARGSHADPPRITRPVEQRRAPREDDHDWVCRFGSTDSWLGGVLGVAGVRKRLQCDGAARPSVGHVTGRKAPTIVRCSPTVTTTRLALLTVGGLVVNLSLGCAGDDQSALGVDGACGAEADLRLVFTRAAGEEGGDLFGLTRDGKVRRLTDDGGSFGSSFSPDGSRILFSSVGDSGDVSDTIGATGLDLHVMAADGSGRRRLLDREEDVSPAWSPDGDQIAFVRGGNDAGAGRIFIVDPDDDRSARALIEPDRPGADADPAWSPDGTRLAFVRTKPDGLSHLMVADADGSDVRSVLERPEALGSPSWSPDGTALAFTVGNGGEAGGLVALLDLEDGSVETVAEGGLA